MKSIFSNFSSLKIPGAIATVAVIVIYYFTPELSKLSEFYSSHLRRSLFSGFLTVGGFLFSLKTFIIIKMKENVYDKKKYRESIKKNKKLNKELTYYGPLKRLSQLLFAAVLASFITAILQFTIGLANCPIASLLCIWAAIFSISLLIASLLIIRENLNDWFDFLEKESEEASNEE